MFTIVSKEMLTPNICKMRVSAPRIAAAAKPGQFVIVRPDEKGERTPLTISDYDSEAGTITIVTQVIGVSSQKIVAHEVGESFADVVGPLGQPSEFVNMDVKGRRYVFIAGGVGTAPVYPQAKWLHERGAVVDVIVGARTKDLLIYVDEFRSVCTNLHICTDDGSEGFHGVGTAKLKELYSQGQTFDECVAIGPMIMMKFSVLACKDLLLPCTVSLNALMVDGTGMCGACRVTIDGKMRFACVDGPEFDGYKVDFDECLRRQAQYKAEEAAAKEHAECHHN